LVGKSEGKRNHLEDLGVDGRIILEWTLKKYGEKLWTGFIWLRRESRVASSCEHGNEPSGFTKHGEFPDQLRDLQASQGLCSMELARTDGVSCSYKDCHFMEQNLHSISFPQAMEQCYIMNWN
jgi:hypothetical protein